MPTGTPISQRSICRFAKTIKRALMTGLSGLFVITVIASCSRSGEIDKFEWILGTWHRINIDTALVHTETWSRASADQYDGIGLRTKNADTVFIEYLSIRAADGNMYYVADVAENPEPVYFEITSQGRTMFVAENPEHDAPQKIAYFLSGDSLKVEVSWESGGFDVHFVKLEN